MRDFSKQLPQPNLILHCQLGCGRETGTVYTPIPMTEDEYRTKTGIIDQRCSQCENDHGTFKELEETFKKELNATPAEAEAFIIKNRKRSDFHTALQSEKTKREKDLKSRDIIQ